MKEIIRTFFLAISVIIFMILLITYPAESITASKRGLNLWWTIVFPSLLPFFVTAELFIYFGIVKLIGTLLEPVMRPLFNIPGVGSFALVLGLASGYPAGAKMSARLREENQLSQIEAERLISFTNAASPLFIFGAIAVGFFQDPHLGLLIAVCHYLGNFIVGLCMRFYKYNLLSTKQNKTKTSMLNRMHHAFKQMHDARLKQRKPLGQLLSDALINAVQTLVVVGGFIMLFSVLNELLTIVGFLPLIAKIIGFLFNIFLIPDNLSMPFISGLFEISLGSELIAEVSGSYRLFQIVIVNFILGFNGLSVQAQVASIIATTDIRFRPYFFARLLHGLISSLLTVVLYRSLYINKKTIDESHLSVLQQLEPSIFGNILCILKNYGPTFTLLIIFITLTIMLKRTSQQKY